MSVVRQSLSLIVLNGNWITFFAGNSTNVLNRHLADTLPTCCQIFAKGGKRQSAEIWTTNQSFSQYYKHQLLNNLLPLDPVSCRKLPALRKGKCQFNRFCFGIFAKVWLTESRKQSYRRLKQRRFTTNILAYLPNLNNPSFFQKVWSKTILCSHCQCT